MAVDFISTSLNFFILNPDWGTLKLKYIVTVIRSTPHSFINLRSKKLYVWACCLFLHPDSALILVLRPTDGTARIFHTEMSVSHTISKTYYFMPCPGFELTSENWTSLRDLNQDALPTELSRPRQCMSRLMSGVMTVMSRSRVGMGMFFSHDGKPKLFDKSPSPGLSSFKSLPLIQAFGFQGSKLGWAFSSKSGGPINLTQAHCTLNGKPS